MQKKEKLNMAVVLLEWVALQPMTTRQTGLDFVSTPTAAAANSQSVSLVFDST
jgi:hypothetical protein